MHKISRWFCMPALALALTACGEDVWAPENLGSLAVVLDISGTPREDSFVVEWADTDSGASGSVPFTLAFPRRTFDQVPRGTTRVALKALPANCASEQTIKTVEVVTSETREVAFAIRCR